MPTHAQPVLPAGDELLVRYLDLLEQRGDRSFEGLPLSLRARAQARRGYPTRKTGWRSWRLYEYASAVRARSQQPPQTSAA
jgi:hypothetical protein